MRQALPRKAGHNSSALLCRHFYKRLFLARPRRMPLFRFPKIKPEFLAEKISAEQSARRRKSQILSGTVLARLHRLGMCNPRQKQKPENRTHKRPDNPVARRRMGSLSWNQRRLNTGNLLKTRSFVPVALMRVFEENSVVSDSERTTPSPRGTPPKTPGRLQAD